MRQRSRWVAGFAVLALLVSLVAGASRLTPSTRLSMQATGSGSHTNTSVAIPSGTTMAVTGYVFANASSNNAPTSESLDSHSGTKQVSIETAGTLQLALYTHTGVASGSGKTLAWTNPVGYTALDIAIEYRNGALSVIGSGDSDNCNGCNSLNTNALTTQVGDEMLCVYAVNGGSVSGVGSGQSQDDQTSGTSTYGFSSKIATGTSTSMSFSFSGGLQGYACIVLRAAPTLSSPTPSGTLGTTTTATLGATTDTTSGTFYSVVDSAANLSGVTVAQVKAGQKASGAAALKSCNASVSTTTPSCGVTGLTAATLYSYASVQNASGGDSSLVTGTFTTASPSGPSISSLTWSKVSNTVLRATITGVTSPANTLRCGAWPMGTATPTAANVAAGTGAHGTNSASSTGSSQTIDITVTDSPAHPAYRGFCVGDAGGGTYSSVPSSSDTCLDPPSGMQYVGCSSGLIGITTAGSVPKLYNDAAFTNVTYDTLTTAFTVDKVLVDQTSGAWGFIRRNSGSVLVVDKQSGTFADNDVIVDSAGGAALVNGATSSLTPRIAVGDILVEPVGVSPGADGKGCPGSGHPACLTFDLQGSFSFSAQGKETFINGLVFHVATLAYLPIDIDMVINNHAPSGNASIPPQVMPLGSIYSLNLNTVFTDADGDVLHYAWLSGSLPPFTLSDSNGVFSGNPATEHETGVDLQFIGYDDAGAYAVQTIKAVPVLSWTLSANCLGQTFAACDAAIRTQTFNSVTAFQNVAACSNSASNAVLTQNPAAGSEVFPGQAVIVTVSSGTAQRCAAALNEQGER